MPWPRGSAPWRWEGAVRCQPLTKSLCNSDAVVAGAGVRISGRGGNRAARKLIAGRPIVVLAIDALQLSLAVRNRTLGVLGAGAVIGEHVDHQEVGDRGRGLLAGGADARRRQRAL